MDLLELLLKLLLLLLDVGGRRSLRCCRWRGGLGEDAGRCAKGGGDRSDYGFPHGFTPEPTVSQRFRNWYSGAIAVRPKFRKTNVKSFVLCGYMPTVVM
jgi:hypothetical protein